MKNIKVCAVRIFFTRAVIIAGLEVEEFGLVSVVLVIPVEPISQTKAQGISHYDDEDHHTDIGDSRHYSTDGPLLGRLSSPLS